MRAYEKMPVQAISYYVGVAALLAAAILLVLGVGPAPLVAFAGAVTLGVPAVIDRATTSRQ